MLRVISGRVRGFSENAGPVRKSGDFPAPRNDRTTRLIRPEQPVDRLTGRAAMTARQL
jgi:hypothetical protein